MSFKKLMRPHHPAGGVTEVREKVMKNDAGEIVANLAVEFERDGVHAAAEHVLLAGWLIARLRDRHKTNRSR